MQSNNVFFYFLQRNVKEGHILTRNLGLSQKVVQDAIIKFLQTYTEIGFPVILCQSFILL